MNRLRIEITGIVQGVGFRPFVHNLAGRLGVAGWVANDGHGVVIEAEGETAAVAAFLAALRAEAPPLAVKRMRSMAGYDQRIEIRLCRI